MAFSTRSERWRCKTETVRQGERLVRVVVAFGLSYHFPSHSAVMRERQHSVYSLSYGEADLTEAERWTSPGVLFS